MGVAQRNVVLLDRIYFIWNTVNKRYSKNTICTHQFVCADDLAFYIAFHHVGLISFVRH